jgi:hypothetical protein
LRFEGHVRRAGTDGNVMTCQSRAETADADPRIPNGEAQFETELAFTGATTFQEVGTIRFGAGIDRLHVSTIGSGFVEHARNPRGRQGAAMLAIQSGEGAFAGSSGIVVSNFVLEESGELTDHLLAVLHLQSEGDSPR